MLSLILVGCSVVATCQNVSTIQTRCETLVLRQQVSTISIVYIPTPTRKFRKLLKTPILRPPLLAHLPTYVETAKHYTLLSILKSSPIVGKVVTISPNFSLYRMVVLPAASKPTVGERGIRPRVILILSLANSYRLLLSFSLTLTLPVKVWPVRPLRGVSLP